MNYLVFRLYGPMASWGEIAVGENRHSARYPGKSAILGLLGAALGIKRDDIDNQNALFSGYTMAVKMLSGGHLLKDYHTAQAPDSVGKFRYRTRRDEIVAGRDRLGTVLSSREYRTDSEAIVVLASSPTAAWSLELLQQALLKPKFHLYLGRKACPLAAPLQPELIEADGFFNALESYQSKELLIDQPDWVDQSRFLKPDSVSHYYWQGSLEEFTGEIFEIPANEVQQLVRHDQPVSRVRWQFQPRSENLWLKPVVPAADNASMAIKE